MNQVSTFLRLYTRQIPWLVPALYAAGIITGEVLLVAVGPAAALTVHGTLLTLLILHAASHEGVKRLVYSALMLHPLLRVISLGVPTTGLPPLVQHAMLGAPLWLALVLIMRVNQTTPAGIGLTPARQSLGWQIGLALLGWPLGLVAALIIHPAPAIASLSPVNLGLGVLIITVFSSAVEEVLFRGVLQTALTHAFGVYGILVTSLMFASAYVGTLSLPFVLLMGAVGLVFGWAVYRTGSLWGAIAAHSLLTCGALLIWPFILR